MMPPHALATSTTGPYPQVDLGAVPRRPARFDPRRLPAHDLPRVRRAPPPVEGDELDLLGYLIFTLWFLFIVW